MWMRHFGRGIVESTANFGRSGVPPSHPELLDWLATEFVRQGWSIKTMQRLMMTSTAYRQSSRRTDASQVDPQTPCCRTSRCRRMDAETLYDSVLRVTGRLDDDLFGPPVEIEIKPDREVIAKGKKDGYRRALYVTQSRQTPLSMSAAFDFPQNDAQLHRAAEFDRRHPGTRTHEQRGLLVARQAHGRTRDRHRGRTTPGSKWKRSTGVRSRDRRPKLK